MTRNVNKYLSWSQLIAFHRWNKAGIPQGPHFDHYNCRIGERPQDLLLGIPNEILAKVLHYYVRDLEHTGQQVRLIWWVLTSSSALYRQTNVSNFIFWHCLLRRLGLEYEPRQMKKISMRETALIHVKHSCTICGCGGQNKFVPELKGLLCAFCLKNCLISLTDLNEIYGVTHSMIKDLPFSIQRIPIKNASKKHSKTQAWVKFYIPADVEECIGKKLVALER